MADALPPARAPAVLIVRWPFYAIDYVNINRNLPQAQAETELLLDRREDGWSPLIGRTGGDFTRRCRRSDSLHIGSPFKLTIEGTLYAGSVDHLLVQLRRKGSRHVGCGGGLKNHDAHLAISAHP